MSAYSQIIELLRQQNHLPLLSQLHRGIEKEGLRCNTQGQLSQQPHPKALGAALTHESITTDYSEALLEFITPVFDTAHETLTFLDQLHKFSSQNMNDELIWPASMPCILNGELSIPIADYGSSHIGQLKHAYRHGLWHRYGRTMQAIAGIHYNFSVPDHLWPLLQNNEKDAELKALSLQDYKSHKYFALIRNFRRYSWLLLVLFGASPAICESFLDDQPHQLDKFKQHTLYAPYATSLRMSDLGYQNNAQADLKVCYNSLDNYVETLSGAIGQSVDAYEQIGLQDNSGQFKQLNSHLLQIENEYYSDIRPKRVSRNGEKPLEALANEGVEYIEVRCTDVNPFLPLGIDESQIHFLDTFLLYCLFSDSAELSDQEYQAIDNNHQTTVMQGRKPGVKLSSQGQEVELATWGAQLLQEMQPLADLLDQANGHTNHKNSVSQQLQKLKNPELTPSAQYLAMMRAEDKEYAELTLSLAKQHAQYFNQPIPQAVADELTQQAEVSWQKQQALETETKKSQQSFADYLAEYLDR